MLTTIDSSELAPIRKFEDQYNAYIAIANFINSDQQIFALSGYAGTGKSFLTALVAQQLVESNWRVVLTAPTNKAVKSLKRFSQNLCSSIDAITLAKLLGVKPVIKQLPDGTEYEDFEPEFGEESKIFAYDVIIVDEASMVHEQYFNLLITELDKAAQNIFEQKQKKIIFVGDPAQLPPIGEEESIAFKKANAIAELKQIVRYDGAIIQAATHLRQSSYPNLKQFVDNKQIYEMQYTRWISSLIAAFNSDKAVINPNFVRLLTWRNKRAIHMNKVVRDSIHGSQSPEYIPGERIIANGTCTWEQNILLTNSEEAEIAKVEWSTAQLKKPTNGEPIELNFFWLTCLTEEGRNVKLRVLFEKDKAAFQRYLADYVKAVQDLSLFSKALDRGVRVSWKEFWKTKKSFHDINYCYALTVHKSQGSTFNNVFVDIPDICLNRKATERNKLLYVAVTRAAERVFLNSK